MSNTFGERFKLTTYGESHGLAVGAVIDGCPSGLTIDEDAIRRDLARRRQGAPRQEEDEVEWLSGIRNDASGMTTLGSSIAFLVRNKNTRSEDYDPLADCYRPGHADYTYQQKYGLRDHRGGGRASARETVARVVAGAIAKQLIAPVQIHAEMEVSNSSPDLGEVDARRADGGVCDTHGGIVSCRITGLPAGIGDPVFNKLNAQLASAMMSIPSAIGFEMGIGFAAATMKGSEYIDRWNDCLSKDAPATQTILPDRQGAALSTAEINQLAKKQSNLPDRKGTALSTAEIKSNPAKNQAITKTNHCGGIQGGISNGMPVEFRVAFHPVVTLPQPVECLTTDGKLRTLQVTGRHDRCQVPRAAVVVEAMAAMVIADYLLDNR